MSTVKKVVLAYTGGLDTSVAVAWLKEQHGADVVTLSVDVGGGSLREGVADAANCNRADEDHHFWRLSIIKEPRDKRSQAVIAISTPQTRVGHTWTADFIRNFLIEGRVLVRVSGWLYFNPESPQEIGRTRATLWEITPVMQIEVFQDGRWNPLDKYGK